MIQSVLIIGTTDHGSLESSYMRALQHKGCKVQIWNPIAALHRLVRGGRLGRLMSTFVHVEPWIRKANVELLSLVDRLRPDLILIIGTQGVRGGTLSQIKVCVPDCLLYCVYPDCPHNLDTDRIHCLPFFDRVTTSSPAWIRAFEKLGAQNVNYLPFAADIELHQPTAETNSRSELMHDVAFIGTWRPEREEFLEQLADFDLCLWGSNYWKYRTRTDSPLRARWGGRSLTGLQFSQACSETKILLNIMDRMTWPGPNMRAFEQPACAAFSLVTRSPAVLDIFTEGENIECFSSVEEAREKIRYYLEHGEARRRIANASYKFVVEQGHTYQDRVSSLFSWGEEDQVRSREKY